MFSEYLALMDYKVGRRDDLDRQIEEVAFSDLYRPQLQKLACFRGISTLSAMTLITEIGVKSRVVCKSERKLLDASVRLPWRPPSVREA